jgi:hypothetical protein
MLSVIHDGSYKETPSIKFKGITKGLKKLSGNAYIEYKSLYWL